MEKVDTEGKIIGFSILKLSSDNCLTHKYTLSKVNLLISRNLSSSLIRLLSIIDQKATTASITVVIALRAIDQSLKNRRIVFEKGFVLVSVIKKAKAMMRIKPDTNSNQYFLIHLFNMEILYH